MKNGIKLEEPNENLAHVYIDKAKSALNILDSQFNYSISLKKFNHKHLYKTLNYFVK